MLEIGLSSLRADEEKITMLVEARVNNEPIGYIKATVNSCLNCVELDTAVNSEFRDMGVATSLLKDMLKKLFVNKFLDGFCEKFAKGTETQKVVLNIDIDNFASRKVAEKLGFINSGASSHDSMEYELTREKYLQNANAKTKKLNIINESKNNIIYERI